MDNLKQKWKTKTMVAVKLEPQNDNPIYKAEGFEKGVLYPRTIISVEEDPILGILIRLQVENHRPMYYTSLMTLADDWWVFDNKTWFTVMRRYADINTTIDTCFI